MDAFSPSRLATARSRRSFTRAALAEEVGVSAWTIGAYENGESRPSNETAEALAKALAFPTAFFFEPDIDRLDSAQVSFRALSRLRARDRDAALAAAELAVIVARWIDASFDLPSLAIPDVPTATPEQAAQALRIAWSLGESPLPSVVHQLEAHGIHVFSLAEGLDLDAFSYWSSGEAFILLNTVKSAERSRFDGCHELGHLILHRHGSITLSKEAEKEAHAFAAAFLMPAEAMGRQVPSNVGLRELLDLKHFWGVSAAAVAFRLHQLQLISSWNYRWLFRELGVRGWRSREPEPMTRERSQVFPKVFEALRREGVDKRDVAQMLRIPLRELEALTFGLVRLAG